MLSHLEEMSVQDDQKSLPISGCKGCWVFFLQIITKLPCGIITVIFYHLGHGSISFHGREILMSSLQYAQIFSILQSGTGKSRITGTKHHDIKEHDCTL